LKKIVKPVCAAIANKNICSDEISVMIDLITQKKMKYKKINEKK